MTKSPMFTPENGRAVFDTIERHLPHIARRVRAETVSHDRSATDILDDVLGGASAREVGEELIRQAKRRR